MVLLVVFVPRVLLVVGFYLFFLFFFVFWFVWFGWWVFVWVGEGGRERREREEGERLERGEIETDRQRNSPQDPPRCFYPLYLKWLGAA